MLAHRGRGAPRGWQRLEQHSAWGGTEGLGAAGAALQGRWVGTLVLWVHLAHGAFFLQMMMQYLYYGGTESMDIPTSDILEVRTWPVGERSGEPLRPSTMPVPSRDICQVSPTPLSETHHWRQEEGRKGSSARTPCFPAGPCSSEHVGNGVPVEPNLPGDTSGLEGPPLRMESPGGSEGSRYPPTLPGYCLENGPAAGHAPA